MVPHQAGNPVIAPSPEYAEEWVDMFRSAYPELRDRAREIYLRLAGHPDWKSMEGSCHQEPSLYDCDQVTTVFRLEETRRIRKVLVEDIGMRPDVANLIAWVNPPGSNAIYNLSQPHSSVLLSNGLPADLERVYGELDALNLSYRTDTAEGRARLLAKADIGAHLGICKYLGWDFDVLQPAISPLASIGDDAHRIAEPMAMVHDQDLGDVPVFVAGFSSTPGFANDQVLVEFLTAALNSTELLKGDGAPGIVFFESSSCRQKDDQYYSCFGALVHNGVWLDLFLNEVCRTVSDLFVHLATTDFESPGIRMFADANLRLQKKFERARQKHLLPVGATGTLYRIESPSGWDQLKLIPE